MKFVLSLLLLFAPPASSSNPKRVDDEALARMKRVFPYVRQVEINTDVPPKIVLGTIYNESSGKPYVKGDGGLSYGLGQIRCFWLDEVYSPNLQYCHDLLSSWKNVYVIGEIFQHFKTKYPDKTWRELVKLYHLGSQALYGYIDDSDYINRTYRFGEIFLPYYRASNVVDDHIEYVEMHIEEVVSYAQESG